MGLEKKHENLMSELMTSHSCDAAKHIVSSYLQELAETVRSLFNLPLFCNYVVLSFLR